MNKSLEWIKKDLNYVDIIWFSVSVILSITIPFVVGQNIDFRTPISIISTVLGLLGSLLLLFKNKFHVIPGIIGNAMLGVVLWYSDVYAAAIINWTVAPLIHIFGAYNWWREEKGVVTIKPKSLNLKKAIIAIFIFIVLSLGIGFALTYAPNSNEVLWVSWVDSTITVLFLFAMLMMAFKYKEQYWVWLVINIAGIIFFALQLGLQPNGYFPTHLIPTLILFSSYLFSSIWGFYRWKVK